MLNTKKNIVRFYLNIDNLILGTIITPDVYLGSIISLCIERRGVQKTATNIDNERVMVQFILPLCEIVVDFHDALKTISSGYASFDYEDNGYQLSPLVKVNILSMLFKSTKLFSFKWIYTF